MVIGITIFIFILFVVSTVYLVCNGKIEQLEGEILQHLELNGWENPTYESIVSVKSARAVDSYTDIDFFKSGHTPSSIMSVIKSKQLYCDKLTQFLQSCDQFSTRYGFNTVSERITTSISATQPEFYRVLIEYISPAGRKTHTRVLYIGSQRVQFVNDHPELLMSKSEYTKYQKELDKQRLESKRTSYYDKVNAIIDKANDAKTNIVIDGDCDRLDKLIQTLIDKTVGWISKVKTFTSDEWTTIGKFISDVSVGVDSIIKNNKRITDYYESEDFKTIKSLCSTLMESQREFNEYINEKAANIRNLFGVRVVRNETVTEDQYNYVHTYKKSITPFTAEVSATVFASAENNPIDYVVKYFYPDKAQYKEQIQKLHTLVEELETLREAKSIIDKYKVDYAEYLDSVPAYVTDNDESGFYARLGFATINENTLTVEYRFNYTSGGGNAQRTFTVPMIEETIVAIIHILEQKLTQKEFAKEQRQMMTAKLRQAIKVRDNFTCRYCGNSTHNEPNLLLEIDHIIPVAKGGCTVEDNLQTLCWKCNRHKSDNLCV